MTTTTFAHLVPSSADVSASTNVAPGQDPSHMLQKTVQVWGNWIEAIKKIYLESYEQYIVIFTQGQ